MSSTIQRSILTRQASNLFHTNSLPNFPSKNTPTKIKLMQDIPAAVKVGAFEHGPKTAFPYLNQDWYDRSQKERSIDIIVLENEYLKATFYPQFGGRLSSLYDKKKSKELLFDNPVFQPCNLAQRNAWFSGGIEFNGPVYGHSMQTCTPVYFAKIQSNDQQILRAYEYDRFRNTYWQIDFILEKDKLWFSPTFRNPNDYDVPFYYWTNIAVPATEKTRFITQFDSCVNHKINQDIVNNDFPMYKNKDISFPDNAHEAISLFFIKKNEKMPWFTAIQEDGTGLTHVSSEILLGKKYWYFGNFAGGLNWMDTLSKKSKGKYIEIQAGIKETQIQDSVIPAKKEISWVECIWGVQTNNISSLSYEDSLETCQNLINEQINTNGIQNKEKWFQSIKNLKPQEILFQGASWGRLQQKIENIEIPGLDFNSEVTEEEKIWDELLKTNGFSENSLKHDPLSWQANQSWKEKLSQSIKSKGTTWLHELLLGSMEFHVENFSKAEEHFHKSIQLKENFQALRALAKLALIKEDMAKAFDLYQKSWNLSKDNKDLFLEIIRFLKNHSNDKEIINFLEKMPATLSNHEDITLTKAMLALNQKDFKKCRDFLTREYVYVREGNFGITDIWFRSFLQEAKLKKEKELDDSEKELIIKNNQPPALIDFRME